VVLILLLAVGASDLNPQVTTDEAPEFAEWRSDNTERIESAENAWEDAEGRVIEADEMEASLVDSPMDALEDAHGLYDEAKTTFGELKEEACNRADDHPDGSRQHELFTTAAEYYGSMESAALFRYTAISILLDNPDGDFSQSEEDTFYARVEQSESHYEDAQESRAELNELLSE